MSAAVGGTVSVIDAKKRGIKVCRTDVPSWPAHSHRNHEDPRARRHALSEFDRQPGFADYLCLPRRALLSWMLGLGSNSDQFCGFCSGSLFCSTASLVSSA